MKAATLPSALGSKGGGGVAPPRPVPDFVDFVPGRLDIELNTLLVRYTSATGDPASKGVDAKASRKATLKQPPLVGAEWMAAKSRILDELKAFFESTPSSLLMTTMQKARECLHSWPPPSWGKLRIDRDGGEYAALRAQVAQVAILADTVSLLLASKPASADDPLLTALTDSITRDPRSDPTLLFSVPSVPPPTFDLIVEEATDEDFIAASRGRRSTIASPSLSSPLSPRNRARTMVLPPPAAPAPPASPAPPAATSPTPAEAEESKEGTGGEAEAVAEAEAGAPSPEASEAGPGSGAGASDAGPSNAAARRVAQQVLHTKRADSKRMLPDREEVQALRRAGLSSMHVSALSEDNDPDYVSFDDLVDSMVYGRSTAIEVRNAFFLTLYYFSTPPRVLHALLTRLLHAPKHMRDRGGVDRSNPALSPQQQDAALFADWRASKLRVVSMLKHWSKHYPEDFGPTEERAVREALAAFPPASWAKYGIHKNRPDIANLGNVGQLLLRSFDKSMEEHQRQKKLEAAMASSPDPRFFSTHAVKNLTGNAKLKRLMMGDAKEARRELLSRSAQEVALQLTLIAMDRTLDMRSPRELMSCLPPAMRRNVSQAKLSNQMSCWVATEVLNCDSMQERVQMVRHWVAIACECLALRNYLTTFEIIYGLSHNSVFRLHGSQAKRAGGIFEALQEPYYTWFTAMTALTSPSENYRAYRKAMAEAKDGCWIPYLGVLLKDVVTLEEWGKPVTAIRWAYEKRPTDPDWKDTSNEEEPAAPPSPASSASSAAASPLTFTPRFVTPHSPASTLPSSVSPPSSYASSSSPSAPLASHPPSASSPSGSAAPSPSLPPLPRPSSNVSALTTALTSASASASVAVAVSAAPQHRSRQLGVASTPPSPLPLPSSSSAPGSAAASSSSSSLPRVLIAAASSSAASTPPASASGSAPSPSPSPSPSPPSSVSVSTSVASTPLASPSASPSPSSAPIPSSADSDPGLLEAASAASSAAAASPMLQGQTQHGGEAEDEDEGGDDEEEWGALSLQEGSLALPAPASSSASPSASASASSSVGIASPGGPQSPEPAAPQPRVRRRKQPLRQDMVCFEKCRRIARLVTDTLSCRLSFPPGVVDRHANRGLSSGSLSPDEGKQESEAAVAARKKWTKLTLSIGRSRKGRKPEAIKYEDDFMVPDPKLQLLMASAMMAALSEKELDARSFKIQPRATPKKSSSPR